MQEPGNMHGSDLSFVDDADLVEATPDHPAIEHLERAIAELRRERPRVAAESLYEAMSIVSEHDGVMAEF